MTRIVATRFAQAVPVMFLVAVLTFFLMHLLPGDPAVIIAGDQASPEAIERMRRQLGLDRPVLEQLVLWIARLAQGDFGTSLILNQSVVSAVVERLPITLSLALVSFVITIPVGIALGVIAACFRDTWFDAGALAVALVGVSLPNFWVAIQIGRASCRERVCQYV